MIDAHQHFWRVDRGDYGWLTPALGPIYRDFMPEDLAPILTQHGITGTILVQAAPTVAETRFLLEVARATPFVKGVVGWVDFEATDAPDTIAVLAGDPLLVGLRPMVQDIADDDWLLRPSLAPALDAMAAHHLVFDALVLPRHLSRLKILIARHPDLAVVVDHGAKPLIHDRIMEPWATDVAAIAAAPHVMCKLSGLVTEAAADWQVSDIMPYAEHILRVFGPQRVLFGSDWPVVNLAGGYDRWREAASAFIQRLDAVERTAILGDNAWRLYLGRRGRH
jgi:L-fucono-1,5-lactonase